MRKSLPLVLACAASVFTAEVAVAQPRPYREGPPPQAYHYYNGRWIGPDEWRRHSYERDRWVRRYDRRRHRDRDDSALVAGIIGFALGAAIVGSAQEAERARSADASFDDYCARRYRSYDRGSRTYLGSDGLRHYCQ